MTDPISPEYRAKMNQLAHVIDEFFNGPRQPGIRPKIGFTLLVGEFDKLEGGQVNYISNGERESQIAMLKEFLARAEGRPVPEAPNRKQ